MSHLKKKAPFRINFPAKEAIAYYVVRLELG